MDIEILKGLLEIHDRKRFHEKILNVLKDFEDSKHVKYEEFKTSNGTIPVLRFPNNVDINKVKHVKVFVGAQHNEYNGLFGIIEFLKLMKEKKINIQDVLIENQEIIFFPLMNPYGFINPSKDNKSGYYHENGSNLNRFWRKIFVPEYEGEENELNQYEFPEEALILKQNLGKYWDNHEAAIYILDFHETSLLYKFPKEMSLELTSFYKFDHWLKKIIIKNIIELYNIPHFRMPLFYKCNSSSDHDHVNLSMKQIDIVSEKLRDYMSKNNDKLSYYFAYSERSERYCKNLARMTQIKLKNKLWETRYPTCDHKFHDHGCFVKMNDATPRENVYCMELESQKQFFNVFEEIEKSKRDPDYLSRKLDSIQLSLDLVVETIKEMIKLF